MDLTPEQAAIVHAGDIDLAVSAGAGTGKTHVLVERYVTLLERCAIAEIVAITFTEAAAAEMRQRVRREVLTRDALKEHQPHVDEALIGTIHSLCLRLLRERPVEAALDPAVQVLSEDQAELLRREACAAAVDAAAEADDARTAALGTLGVYQAGLMLPSMVASRDEVRASFAVLPAVAEDMAAHLRALVDAACEEALGPLRDSIPPVLDDLRPSVLDPSDKLAQCLEAAAEALDSGAEGDLDEWARSVAEAIRCINLTGGKKASWAIDVPEVRAHLKAARTAMEAALALAAPWNDADAGCSAALPGLRALFEDACGRYEAAKHEQHGLDFLDLEIAAVDLLETHPEVAAAYRRAWRHLMVDEAQDVSGIQARLIRALLGTVGADGATEGERPRLFLVGDEKQSIYRFRGADVRQFRDLRVAVSAAGGQVLPLSASFRTHTDLVERMNGLFESAFDGREVLMERMSGRPGVSPVGPHVVVTGIDASDRNGHAQRLTEADLVAAEVAGLIEEGRLVWDKRAREYRAVRWGDIAILLRRYTNVHVFEHALEAHHVPFATPSGTGFFTRQEVLDLGNLLRWLHEPDDEIALFGVLRSPLFILRDDTLYALRAGRRPLLLAAADPPEGIATDERARCLFATETLRALQRSARTAPAADLLDEALAATGFEASWAPLSGGDQVLANVRKLVRLCHDLAGYTLGEVVDYLERRRDDLVAREGPAVLDRADAVQIMTVHGAKGLEFPVVFAPEAHTAPYIGNDAVRWRAGEGVSFTLERGEDDEQRPRPAFFSLLLRRESEDEAEEHLRLFYVAATRAADYLYVSGDRSGERGWMSAIDRAVREGALEDVDWREDVTPDTAAIARRPAPEGIDAPPADAEVAFTPDLLLRPRVIPLRTSTPATAIRRGERSLWARGDGLGRVRGTIVHRAIEAAYALPRPEGDAFVDAITAEEADDLDEATRTTLATEAREMLARFRESPTGRAVEAAGAAARFEAPFAWDWDGIPVHGQIDLLVPEGGRWRVIDFKTDRVQPGGERAAAQGYLVQIGLYARALEAATGQRPAAGLLFLRTGTLHEPSWDEMDAALAAARVAVDAGMTLDATPEYPEYEAEPA